MPTGMRPLPHSYTNDARTDGSIVVKRYLGPRRVQRRDTERSVLGRLPPGLPIPRPQPAPDGELIVAHLPGVPGQELVTAGYAGRVLSACGGLLRRLQLLEVRTVFPYAGGGVLVHGDFGPNNMLLDPDTFAVTGLVDWEWAHPGDPIEDLAWCEWIIRMHHPAAVGDLEHLFAAYRSRPPWRDRQAAMAARCSEFADLLGAGPAARTWQDRAALTRSWTE
jgi:phosphotransferase family enzyme